MSEGYRRALNKDKMVFSWAEWLLVNGQRDQAKELLQDRLSTDPSQSLQALPLLETHRFTRQDIIDVLPRRVDTWVSYGDLMEKVGDLEESEYFRSQALGFLRAEEEDRGQMVHPVDQFLSPPQSRR